MSRARTTRRRGSVIALTGAVGRCPLTKHNSLQKTFPTPAITRWSSSASAIRRSGLAIRLSAAMLRVPVLAQQIGSQVVNGVLVVVAFQNLQHAQVDADRADISCFQDDSNPVVGPTCPRRDPPAAIHLQVRVDTGRPDADEQVLAAAAHLVDHMTAQVDRGIPRHPNIAAGQRVTDQRLPQSCLRYGKRCHPRAWAIAAADRAESGRTRRRSTPSPPSREAAVPIPAHC